MTDIPMLPLPSGAAIPVLGFGTWPLRSRAAYDAVRGALDAGYRHLDTATMYRNEAEIGRAIADSGIARRELFLTTKLPGDRAGSPRDTLTASLDALRVDQVDLWLIHWPPEHLDSVEVWREFVTARAGGLVRDIGVSNYTVDNLDEIVEATGVAPVVNQIEWSPPLFDQAVLDDHRARGVVVEGYSPLKTADLNDATLAEIGSAHGVSPARVILRWHVQHDIVVIPKSATPGRIVENADIFGFDLTDEEMARIDALGSR
jgi:2,5-diketo-D-gluconate reductase A